MLRSGKCHPVPLRPGFSLLALCLLFTAAPSLAAEKSTSCASIVARIVSVERTVEVRRAGQANWVAVKGLDTPVCQGDLLRTGRNSRAALVVLPEKFIRLDQNSAISISMAGNQTIVEFFQDGTASAVSVGKACGAGYFITRYPRDFKVRTRFLNAAVEGTEFLVGLSCDATTVAVFEGKVSAEAAPAGSERLMLNPGESVSAGPGERPVVKLLVKPADAVQWAVYYPPLNGSGIEVGIDEECTQASVSDRSHCLTLRAEQRLRVGRVDGARADIAAALALIPDNADASALLAIISVVRNETTEALAQARRATELDPASSRAWIALSYAEQASFQLEDALASAERAAQLAPRSSTAQARVAELLMSLGRIRPAERAAQAAVDANPHESRARTVLGFVHLAQIDTRKARADFLAAIERDSSDPLPRLGLGLAIIRDGDLVAGREQIEIAVMLDPTNSLIRSYVGKAYYEENSKERDKLAGTQFGLAKQLDPNDPTPWFYDAILKETQNRPIEALKDIEQSIDRNDKRAVYRSRLLLDEDLAARSANLARIYGDLGFQQRAMAEAYRSLETDPTNYSAHRFLSDAYLTTPRYEVGRLSELLQSQLWQPLNLQPLQPQLGESGLFIVQGTGPSRLSSNEFSNLFVRNGLHVAANAIVGEHQTFGNDLVIAGLLDSLSVSLGQFHYQTDGFRPNNDQRRDIQNAFVQYAVSPSTSIQAEYRIQHSDAGDLQLRFDPENFSSLDRNVKTTHTARIGFRHDLSVSSQIIGVHLTQDAEETSSIVSSGLISPTVRQEVRSNSSLQQRAQLTELQHVGRRDSWAVITGLGYFTSDNNGALQIRGATFLPGLPPFPFTRPSQIIDDQSQQLNGYVYAKFSCPADLHWTLGLSASDFKSPLAEGTQINPKFGLVWTPTPSTVVRLAAFRVLQRDLVANQTIEPTEVAGFNQFFDDTATADAVRYGLGLDQRVAADVFAGFEISKRAVHSPYGAGSISTHATAESKEQMHRGYIYWTATRRLAVRVEYQYEELQQPNVLIRDAFNYAYLRTQRLPLGLVWFDPSGWSFSTTATLTDQFGRFFNSISRQVTTGSASFWLVDAQLSYELPRRLGQLSLGVKNLFDRQFKFFEPVPDTPTVSPGRFVYLRVQLRM